MTDFITTIEPFKHQWNVYNKYFYPMLDGDRDILALFMEQGTGKSKTAIDLVTNLHKQGKIDACMVVAPNGVHLQWDNEQIPEHCAVDYESFAWLSKSTKGYKIQVKKFLEPAYGHLKFFCVNVEAFSTHNHIDVFKTFLQNHRTFMIVDESTRIKNPTANRTATLCYYLAKLVKDGRKVKEVIHYSKYRAILTGTMITNSPYDLWSMFEFLRHDYFGMNYYAFKNKFGIEIRDTEPFSGRTYNRKMRKDEMDSIRKYHVEDGLEYSTIAGLMGTTESNVKYIVDHPEQQSPYKNLDFLKRTIEKDSFIIRKHECLDLPPEMYQSLYVEMNKEQKRIYNDLKKKLIAEYMEKELTVKNKVSLIGRLQQITGGFFPYDEEKGKPIPITCKNPKMEALKREVEETGDEKIIVWARFVAEIQLIRQELTKAFPEKRIETYYGAVNTRERHKIIDAFKAGEVDIFISNKTASTGLNLQICHYQIFYSNSYSLEDRIQMEARSHRSGQKHAVLYKDLVMKGTVDEQVYSVLKNKKDLLDYFRNNSISSLLMKEY